MFDGRPGYGSTSDEARDHEDGLGLDVPTSRIISGARAFAYHEDEFLWN